MLQCLYDRPVLLIKPQSSAAQRFGNLETLKRPQDDDSMNRRQSLHDSYGKPGILGSMWNKYAFSLLMSKIQANVHSFTRGPAQVLKAQPAKETQDTTTLGR
jgi:hypothetical protein